MDSRQRQFRSLDELGSLKLQLEEQRKQEKFNRNKKGVIKDEHPFGEGEV